MSLALRQKGRGKRQKSLNSTIPYSLPAAIWTEDYDFFGCGCPTWTTQTLLLQLN